MIALQSQLATDIHQSNLMAPGNSWNHINILLELEVDYFMRVHKSEAILTAEKEASDSGDDPSQ